MPSTYTAALRLEEIGVGEQDGTWGPTTTSNLRSLEQAVAGLTQVVLASDANVTLSTANNAPDQARSAVLVVTSSVSLSATRDVIVPGGSGVTKVWAVRNSTTGGQSIRVKTATGAAVTIPSGQVRLVYCDGTDCALAVDFGEVGVRPGTLVPTAVAALTPDVGYLWADGAAVSRTTYRVLFEALTTRPTCNVAAGSATLTAVSSTDAIWPGSPISGPGIPAGATVASIGVGTITMSVAATSSHTGVEVCAALHGVGDGSTTFNVPDARGRALFGQDTTGTRLTAAVAGFDPTRPGAVGGSQFLHVHGHAVTDPGHAHGYSDPGHTHSVTDPGHGHGVNDPQHSHGSASGNVAYANAASLFVYPLTASSGNYIGFGSLTTDSVATGISVASSSTGISVSGSGTGITITGSATGLTVDSAGAGNSQNIPPALIVRWQIKF